MVKLQARRIGVSLAKFNIVCKKSVALKIDVVCSIGLHLLETLIFVAERLMRGKIKNDFDNIFIEVEKIYVRRNFNTKVSAQAVLDL